MTHSSLLGIPTPSEAMDGVASDAGGTGESRSAAADAGPEARDIGVDRIFTPRQVDADIDEDEDADLAFVDEAGAEAESGPIDPDKPEHPEPPIDEPENEDDDPVGEPSEEDRRPGR